MCMQCSPQVKFSVVTVGCAQYWYFADWDMTGTLINVRCGGKRHLYFLLLRVFSFCLFLIVNFVHDFQSLSSTDVDFKRCYYYYVFHFYDIHIDTVVVISFVYALLVA